jgi:hypothetical protein
MVIPLLAVSLAATHLSDASGVARRQRQTWSKIDFATPKRASRMR